jgi:hypothetical protein
MKFISRNVNYRYTIKHSMPAEPLTGRSAEPGIHVRFVNGIAIINDENVIKALKSSENYGRDFISAEEKDDALNGGFIETKGLEPEHDLQVVTNGRIEKTLNTKPVSVLDKDRQKKLDKMIEDKAMAIAEKMAPAMAKKILESLVSANDKKAVGRPKKIIEPIIEEENIEDVEMLDDDK